jgi:hypothetical protein
LRLARGLSEARRFPSKDAGTAFGEDLGAACGVTDEIAIGDIATGDIPMNLKFSVADLTIHRIIEQETTFLPALEMTMVAVAPPATVAIWPLTST